nr:hydroxymethylglutaryl-CoA synthase [Candidatus Njordarchaeota archaeon]
MVMKPVNPVGIVGWGGYIPRYRITVEEIARVWGKDPKRYKVGLLVDEKAIAGPDEDPATIAIEAAKNAVLRSNINVKDIGAVFTGSESKPYAVKPTGTVVAEVIGATPLVLAADFEFACKAGTEAFQCGMGLVASDMVKYSLAIGADVSQGAPGDDLEFTAAAGGAAFVIGRSGNDTVADIEASCSFVTDTPDFWRRQGQPYPRHGESFTGQPAYFRHVTSAAKMLMDQLGYKANEFNYAVFHQPNGKFPVRAANSLGFTMEKIKPGFLVSKIGNTYSGSSPLGLAAILDIAKPGERILVVSYGSGAGSDAFSITVKDGIDEKRWLAPFITDYIDRKSNVDYSTYIKWYRMIVTPSD